MENTGVMNVELRKSTRKGDNNQLKREGYLLGNIAGKGVDSISIAVKKDVFRRSMKEFGRNFQMVSFSEKIKQEVAIKITGAELLESKRLLINSTIDSILLEGLPQNIPDEIVIDVSNMEAGESIQFSDIKLPEGLTSTIDPEQKMITVVGSKIREAVEGEEEAKS